MIVARPATPIAPACSPSTGLINPYVNSLGGFRPTVGFSHDCSNAGFALTSAPMRGSAPASLDFLSLPPWTTRPRIVMFCFFSLLGVQTDPCWHESCHYFQCCLLGSLHMIHATPAAWTINFPHSLSWRISAPNPHDSLYFAYATQNARHKLTLRVLHVGAPDTLPKVLPCSVFLVLPKHCNAFKVQISEFGIRYICSIMRLS